MPSGGWQPIIVKQATIVSSVAILSILPPFLSPLRAQRNGPHFEAYIVPQIGTI
jgi:hypothetical protein